MITLVASPQPTFVPYRFPSGCHPGTGCGPSQRLWFDIVEVGERGDFSTCRFGDSATCRSSEGSGPVGGSVWICRLVDGCVRPGELSIRLLVDLSIAAMWRAASWATCCLVGLSICLLVDRRAQGVSVQRAQEHGCQRIGGTAPEARRSSPKLRSLWRLSRRRDLSGSAGPGRRPRRGSRCHRRRRGRGGSTSRTGRGSR